MKMRDCPSECGTVDTYGTDWCVTQPFPAGVWGRCKPPSGVRGRAPEANAFWQKSFTNFNLKSGLFLVAVYTHNSDPISDVHWLVRRKIGSAVRGCAKLVDIRTCIENDRLVTSLVYCAIYAQLLVLRALGGASYRTGIILVVVRMAASPATTSSALAHLVHRQWFIMHPWTRVDRWGTGGDASRRYLYTPVSITQAYKESGLGGDKTH